MSPEQAHHFTVDALHHTLSIPLINSAFRSWLSFEDQNLEKQLMGLNFRNPVGLAAGFDKDGQYFEDMSTLGFGFIEIGTVTPKPQAGNTKPRLFRLPADKALINRMGFNNQGVDELARRLERSRPEGLILGGNIGKNKATPNESASADYLYCFDALHSLVDYFVVNISSPNTPDLRSLQDKEPLRVLLSEIQNRNKGLPLSRSILLKIAPDLSIEQLDDILDILRETELDGIIATNTTIDRSSLKTDTKKIEEIGAGGLSGSPLRQRSTEFVRYIRKHAPDDLTIIGVGGIDSPEAAAEKLKAGADLIQLYSGLVYEGPLLVRKIKQSLLSY